MNNLHYLGRAFLLCLVLAAPVDSNARAETPRKKLALLIGIQSYSRMGSDWQDLDGPLNDVALVRQVLTSRFGFEAKNIDEVLDTEATRGNIEKAFERLTSRAKGALVYIHYSGHGSRVADVSGDEGSRKKDSTLVPFGARSEGSWEILDDEINVWLERLLEQTPDVVFVVDACHSGTITRSAGSLKSRGAPTEDPRPYTWARDLGTRGPRELASPGRRFVRISASQDQQLAQEYEAADGTIHGLLTWEWCSALMSVPKGATYAEAFQVAAARMVPIRGDQQRPQIEGAQGTVIFSGDYREPDLTLAVTAGSGGIVHFQGGLLNGVTRNSEFSLSSADGLPGMTRVRIDSVRAFVSAGTILEGKPPAPGDIFRETRHAYPFPPTRIRIVDRASSAGGLVQDLAARIAATAGAVRVADEAKADMILDVAPGDRGSACTIRDGSEAIYGTGVLVPRLLESPLAAPGDPERIAWKVSRLLANRNIMEYAREFETPEKNLSVRLVSWPPGVTDRRAANAVDVGGDLHQVPSGHVVGVVIVNRLPGELYFSALNLTPAGQCQALYPGNHSADETRIPPGGTEAFALATLTDVGFFDTYVCFLTGTPQEFSALNDPVPLDGLDTATRGPGSDPDFDRVRQVLEGSRVVTRGGGSTDLIARTFPVLVGAAGP